MTTTAFRDVRVFDGTGMSDADTVLVRDGVIAATGPRVAVPPSASLVEGRGELTLLPGLIDAHTHALGSALRHALTFGVTTELDMANDPALVRRTKTRLTTGRATELADLRSAGAAATVPGGHGTTFAPDVPTLSTPAEAPAFVAARLAEGSDYIKIHYDDGQLAARIAGRAFVPVLPRETMAAVAAAARARGRHSIAHVGTLRAAHEAIESGVGGLAHAPADRSPTVEFGALAAERGVFLIATLVLMERLSRPAELGRLADDPWLAPYLADADHADLCAARSGRHPALLPDMTAPLTAVAVAHEAGVPVLAGTDSVLSLHGAALHRELELLCVAGLTPSAALAAATSVPAAVFGLTDRGRIADGLRADLLLVEGDPTRDIRRTRRIAGVWKQGERVRRIAKPVAARAAAR